MSLFRRTLLLVANQIASRGFTFVLNLLVVRHVGKEVFGLQAIQLYLLNTTILFLSREGLRRACQRFTQPSLSLHLSQLVNLAWLAVAVSVLCTFALVQVFLYWPPPNVTQFSIDYPRAVWVYGASALIEMLSEPLYVVAQNQLLVGMRVKVDSVATVVRCVVTYLSICWGGEALMGFAYGQVVYAMSVTIGYYISCLRSRASFHPALQSVSQLFPHTLARQAWTDPSLLRLALNFSFQSFEKLLLTEGEKMVLMGMNTSLEEQGVYGLVSNLGSLVARILFQPLEESAFTEFSRSLQTTQNNPQTGEEARGRAVRLLNVLTRFLALVGSVLVVFGPNYAFVFLDTFYGVRWSAGSAPEALSWYCVYLLIIAVNGVTEAFFFSAVSSTQLATYNGVLVGFSIGYLAACSALVRFGAKGLILANCVNMLARIAYSTHFIRSSFATALSKEVLPPLPVALALVICFVTTRYSLLQIEQHTLAAYVPHIGVGVACLGALLTTAYVTQRRFLADFRAAMSAR